jgi:hypothetical protein
VGVEGVPRCPSSLRLNLIVYEDHTVITVTRVVDLPCDPSVRRLSHRGVDLGRREFKGVSLDGIIHLLSYYLWTDRTKGSPSDPAEPSASPLGIIGGGTPLPGL